MTLQSNLDGRGPRRRKKGVRSGSHLNGENRQRADENTDKHAEKQYPRRCRGGYLGPDALGFLSQLTLLRAHGKGGEQGLSIREWEGRVSVSQASAASFSLGSPLTSPPSLYFPDLAPNLYTLRTPNAEWGLHNLARLDYSLSSSVTLRAPQVTNLRNFCPPGPWSFHPSCPLDIWAFPPYPLKVLDPKLIRVIL